MSTYMKVKRDESPDLFAMDLMKSDTESCTITEN